ncbi:MAG: hypothetical protein ACLTDS_04065 [Bianqueaceae bacterium]
MINPRPRKRDDDVSSISTLRVQAFQSTSPQRDDYYRPAMGGCFVFQSTSPARGTTRQP